MTYTEDELTELTRSVHDEVVKRLPAKTPVMSIPVEQEGRVEVVVKDVAAATIVQEVIASLSASSIRLSPKAPVTYRVLPEMSLGDDKAVVGGSALSTCTGAFAVAGGTYRGLITAEHCQNSQAYGGQNILTFLAQSRKSEGDMQWHSSSTGAAPRFRASWSVYRDVNENLPVKEGDGICRFGKTTNVACGEIHELSVCYTTENGSYCNITLATRSMGSEGGDSGGPVYWGNAALGVWKGSHYDFPYTRGAFTRTFNIRTNVLRGVYLLEAR